MSWKEIKEALGENATLLKFAEDQESNIQVLTTKYNDLEIKSKDIQDSRDKTKSILNGFKNKTGLESLDDDSIDNYIAGLKKNSGDDSAKAEIDNLMKALDDKSNQYKDLESNFTNFQRETNTKDVINKYSTDPSVVPSARIDVENRIKAVMSYDEENKPTFKNPNGTTKLVDGKPADFDAVFAEIKTTSPHLFNATTASGGGAQGNEGNGTTVGKIDGTKAEQEAYIKQKYNI